MATGPFEENTLTVMLQFTIYPSGTKTLAFTIYNVMSFNWCKQSSDRAI